MAKIGDTVRFLNQVGGGTITKIQNQLAYVADDDGFETPVLLREIVVVDSPKLNTGSKTQQPATQHNTPKFNNIQPPAPTKEDTSKNIPTDLPLLETEQGDVINLTLGFEAVNITDLTKFGYELSLVNDSNYYLYFTLLKRDDEQNFTTMYAGIVEPNIQLLLAELTSQDTATIENLVLQAVAFKQDKPFKMQLPINATVKVDATKFYKPHCFRLDPYFEKPALTFPLVIDGKPAGASQPDLTVLTPKLEPAAPTRQTRKMVRKHDHTAKNRNAKEPLVVDLHINELLDNTAGLSSADMLNHQIDTFRNVMDQNLRNIGKKIIFIHGKGEGVLRHALEKELNHRYKGHDVCDASFREYGYGATQVTIRNTHR